MDSIGYLDELIKEYLLFRGYIKTYTAFTSEKIHDKTDHPDADVIAEQLLNHIRQLELAELTELWATLTSRFFTHLPASFTPTIRMIEQSLKRAYLVKAVKTGEKERVREFYERFASEMTQPGAGWDDWFVLPYLREPSTHPIFASYFNKRWFHTLALSLKNFLSSAFAAIPLPKLLAFNTERTERKQLSIELKQLKAENERVKRELSALKQQMSSKQAAGNNAALSPAGAAVSSAPPAVTASLPHSLSQPLRAPAQSTPHTPPATAGSAAPQSTAAGAAASAASPPASASAAAPSSPDDEYSDPPFLVTHDVLIPPAASGPSAASAMAKVRFSVDGTKLAAGSRDGSIRVYSLDRLLEAVRDKPHVGAGAETLLSMLCTVPPASPQYELSCLEWDARKDQYLAYGGSDGRIRLWSLDSRRQTGELEMARDFPVVIALASSPADKFLVSSSGSRQTTGPEAGKGVLEAWDAAACKRVLQFTVDSAQSQLNSLVFNHNGSMLVTAGADGMIRIYDMSTKKPIMGWPAHPSAVCSVRLCSDETTVISSGLDGRIVEWSLHRIGRLIRVFSPPAPPPLRAELAMDGDNEHFLLSSVAASSPALLYDINAARPVMTAGAGHSVTVDWHPAMPVIAAGGADGSVRIRGMVKRSGWVVRGESSRVGSGEDDEDEEEEDEEDGEDEAEEGEEGEDGDDNGEGEEEEQEY